MNQYGRFASAVVQGARFGQTVDLPWYMTELNAKIGAFDAWTVEVQLSSAVGSLGPSYFEGWSFFAHADPPFPKRKRPSGWFAFFAETLPTLTPGASDQAIRAIVESYELEFVRYYDLALAGGADPPLVRPQPPGEPAPEPGGHAPGDGPLPPPRAPTAESVSADFGVGALFLLAGVALLIASKTK